jgi:hypothetical protein
VADRYCRNCGHELGQDDRFCSSCGRAIHETAVIPTPEADVPVPPLTERQEPSPGLVSGEQRSSAVSASSTRNANSTRNAFIALGVGVGVVVLGIAAYTGAQWAGVLLMLMILPALAIFLRTGNRPTILAAGPAVLRQGSERPIPEAERSRLLDEEVGTYMRKGFFVRQRTTTTAQLVRPKRFSFVWALLWFLLFGVGIVVYLIYYAAKQDEGRYLEVDGHGAVKATRQIRHVL